MIVIRLKGFDHIKSEEIGDSLMVIMPAEDIASYDEILRNLDKDFVIGKNICRFYGDVTESVAVCFKVVFKVIGDLD